MHLVRDKRDLQAYIADAHAMTFAGGVGPCAEWFECFLSTALIRLYAAHDADGAGTVEAGGIHAPPYGVVHDITALVFAPDRMHFRVPAGCAGGEVGSYRDWLDHLQRYDPSIRAAAGMVARLLGTDRRVFLSCFMVMLCIRLIETVTLRNRAPAIHLALTDRRLSPGEFQRALREAGAPRYLDALRAATGDLARAAQGTRQPLFAERDLFVFRYYVHFHEQNRRAAQTAPDWTFWRFVKLLGGYGDLCRSFLPYSSDVIRRARRIREKLIPVKEESLFSFGGYAGIRQGGNPEVAGALLPSELAYIEDCPGPVAEADLFDVNLAEQRLLYFARERNFTLRKRRKFHIIFWNPDALDYRHPLLPGQWSFVLLSVVFQMIALFRDVFMLRYYPFQFVFNDPTRTSDLQQVLRLVAGRDFPDVEISEGFMRPGDIEGYLDAHLQGDAADHSCVFFMHRDNCDEAVMPPRYAFVHHLRVSCGGAAAGNAAGLRIEAPAPESFDIQPGTDYRKVLTAFRDELTLRVIAGRLHAAPQRATVPTHTEHSTEKTLSAKEVC
jgi:hypothetical protein